MFGKQDTDDYEVYAKLIGKPHTEKIHQLFTIRRERCIKLSSVRTLHQPGMVPSFLLMTWMVAEILLSLLTATRHEGLEAGWEVNFEPRMTHT